MVKQYLFVVILFLLIILFCNYMYSDTSTASSNAPLMRTDDNDVSRYLKPPNDRRIRTIKRHVNPASQVGQDKTVYEIMKKTNGFFIEIGAFDGITLSNSLWLEQQYNWTGLLIEANPDLCKAIDAKKRYVWRLCACISASTTEEYVKGGTLGGNKNSLHPAIVSRYNNKNTILVPCFDLITVLDIIGRKDIDYFSLDVEGAELNILDSLKDSLKANLITVSVWTIEFRIYDGNRNVDEDSKIKLNKIRHFFNSIGGYFEYSILPKDLKDYKGLDVIFVRKVFWCEHHSHITDKTNCD